MRTIEDMAERMPNLEERLRVLQYTHAVLIRALDEAEEQ